MMPKRDGPEIDVSAIGTGCLTLIVASCASVVLLIILLVITGGSLTQLTPQNIPSGVKWASFILRSAMHIGVGYMTARRARHAKMAHAVFLGGIMMLLGAVGFVLPSPGSALDIWGILFWLLTIPLTRYGAKLALQKQS